jgi:hypothetical protein
MEKALKDAAVYLGTAKEKIAQNIGSEPQD